MTVLQCEDCNVTGQVAANMRDRRKSLGWSAQRLSDELEAIGFPLTRDVIANIESGRRQQGITVDELIAFARALEVRPTDLLP